jgi:RHS repeat-associated protein
LAASDTPGVAAWGDLTSFTRCTGSVSTFYSFDPQGNVCQRFNLAGAVLSTDTCDAFGGTVTHTPSGVSDVFGFGAQYGYLTEPDTGLLLLTNRYYDPGTGRFLNRDPIGYAGGTNLYSFVGNSPLRGIDPSGLCDDDDGIDALQDAYGAFWKAVDKVGDALNTGVEIAGALNPFTSAEIGINKIGQGKYLQGALYLVPLVGGALGEGAAVAEEGGVFFHGTDIQSASHFLNGGELDAGAAAAAKAKLNLGGGDGFYLATDYAAGEFFAWSRQPGAVLRYDVDAEALAQLKAAGATHGPIPFGGGGMPPGDQLFVPPGGFGLFNQLRAAGKIRVGPAGG